MRLLHDEHHGTTLYDSELRVWCTRRCRFPRSSPRIAMPSRPSSAITTGPGLQHDLYTTSRKRGAPVALLRPVTACLLLSTGLQMIFLQTTPVFHAAYPSDQRSRIAN